MYHVRIAPPTSWTQEPPKPKPQTPKTAAQMPQIGTPRLLRIESPTSEKHLQALKSISYETHLGSWSSYEVYDDMRCFGIPRQTFSPKPNALCLICFLQAHSRHFLVRYWGYCPRLDWTFALLRAYELRGVPAWLRLRCQCMRWKAGFMHGPVTKWLGTLASYQSYVGYYLGKCMIIAPWPLAE